MEESALINHCKQLIIKTLIRDITSSLELISLKEKFCEKPLPLYALNIAVSELEKEGKVVLDEGVYYILNPDKGFKNS